MITGSPFRGWGKILVIDCAAITASNPARSSFHQHITIERKVQRQLQRSAYPTEASIQFLRLRDSSWKAIENESTTTFRTPEPFRYCIDHNFIGD